MAEPGGLRVIITYKATKGSLQLVAGLTLIGALLLGRGESLHAMAVTLREYVTARLAVEAADGLLSLSTPNHLVIASVAIALDGVVGLVEAWLIHRRKTWAFWVVVAASSLLVPWEVYELFAHFRALRVVLLVLNLGVIVYLSLQARRHTKLHSEPLSP